MLARRTPLKRKTRLRPRSLTKKHARRERDRDYLDFIRWCKCCLEGTSTFSCTGSVEADHAGGIGTRGLSLREPDSTSIPLCRGHHRQRTGTVNRFGHFKGWTTDQMRVWCERQIKFHRTLYENCVRMGQTPWRRKVA